MARKYGKRQRFGDRYVARNASGEFISNVGVGRSLAADRRRKAKDQDERSGFGQMGDERRAEYEAQGYNDKLDESLGMSHKESKMKQSLKARRDESKGMKKASGKRAYSRVGTMDMNADYFENAAGGFYPTGDGRAFGSMTLDNTYAPLAAAEGDITSGFKMGMGATLGVIGGLAFAGWVGGMMSSLSDKKDE